MIFFSTCKVVLKLYLFYVHLSSKDIDTSLADKEKRHNQRCLFFYSLLNNELVSVAVVMGATVGSFFKPEKNLEFFRLKDDPIDGYPGKLE